jgi:hypothetical protein
MKPWVEIIAVHCIVSGKNIKSKWNVQSCKLPHFILNKELKMKSSNKKEGL